MATSYVKVGGEVIRDALLSAIHVTHQLNQHSWCYIECRQTRDERFPIEQALGKPLQVMAYNGNGAEHIVFDGFVLEGDLEYEIYGTYLARLTAVSRSYKLSLTAQQAYFLKKTLKDIAQHLAGEDGLKANVRCADRRPLNYVQWGEPDFDFLRRIADDHGCWMRPSADGIEIFDSFQDGAEVNWSEEGGLLSFRLRGKLAQPAFNGTHYDPQEMQSKTFEKVRDNAQFFSSAAPLVNAVMQQSQAQLPPGYLHSRARAVTLDDYESQLKKESVRSIGAAITGVGTSRNPDVRPGDKLNIKGTLDAKGVYGVTKVSHHWTAAGYINEFECTPWMQYTDPNPPEPRRWYGVVPARVVEHNDPKKMGRVKVQYIFQEEGPAHWARMMTPHAGADRGFMFMPEVGDEVVVLFEDGDPERPVILGCVWNGVDNAPRQEFWGGELDENDVKRIVTKSGHRLQFVDKQGKESIALATPSYLKLSMIEKTDETGRSMITLHSENGDIFLSAPNGRIHLTSKYLSREVGELG